MSAPSAKIKPYDISDKSSLLNLIDLNTPNFFAVSERADFETYMEQERELYYVIELEGKIIGSGGINFQSNKTVGVISWDLIHPEYHGKSFGKQLLNHRIEKLNSIASIEKIIVRTSQITYLFYQKQGFQIIEIVPNYWAAGFDLYYMEYVNN